MSNSVKTTLQERALSIFRAFMAIVLTIGLGIPAAGLQALSSEAYAAEDDASSDTAESQGVQVSVVNNPKIDIVVAGKNTETINYTSSEDNPNKLLDDVCEILERDYDIDASNVLSMNVKTVETQTTARKTEKTSAEEIKRRYKLKQWMAPHGNAFASQAVSTSVQDASYISNFIIDDKKINNKTRPTIYMSTSSGYQDVFVDSENYVTVTRGTDFDAVYETTFGATNELGTNTTNICGEAIYWYKLDESSKNGYGICFDNHTGCGFFSNNDNTLYLVTLKNGYLQALNSTYVSKFSNWKGFPEFGVRVTETNGVATIQIWPNNARSALGGTGTTGGNGEWYGTDATWQQGEKASTAITWSGIDVGMYDTPFTQGYGFWAFPGIYWADCATTMKRTVTKSFGDILDEPEWTDGALHLVINMDTKKDNTLAGVDGKGKNLLAANTTRLLSDNVHLIQWGSKENKDDAEKLIKANKGNGAFFFDIDPSVNTSGYDANSKTTYEYEGGAEPRKLGIISTGYQGIDKNATSIDSSGGKVIHDEYYTGLLDKFVRYLVDHIGQNKRTNTVYVNEPFMVNVVPESLKTNATSNNYPSGRWRFYHNPYVYDEIDKKDPYDASVKRDENGNVVDGWSDYSPEMTCEFEKPGEYLIQFDDKDILEIYAQRRAKADFDISVDTDGQFHFEHKSYDYDKYNTKTEFGRGIKSAEFSYQITRQDGSNFIVEDWKDGTPESYDPNVYTYTIRLKVKDFQAQSDDDAVTCTKYIGNGIPVASYTINDTTLNTNESLDIVNKSYDPTAIAQKPGVSSQITSYTWDLINDAGMTKNSKYKVVVDQNYANTYLGGDMTKFPANAFNLKNIAAELDGPNATTSDATYRLRLVVAARQTTNGVTQTVESMPYIQAFTLSNPRITNTVVHKARVVADDGTKKDITLKTATTTVEEGKETNVGQLLLKSSFIPTGFEAPTTYTYSYTDASGAKKEETKGNSVPLVQTANPQTIELVYLAQNPKINYNVNGGSFDNDVTLAKSYLVGTQVTVPTPKRTGYTFNGWKDTLTQTEYKVDKEDPSVTYINKGTNILAAETVDDLHAATYGKTTSKLNLKAMWTVKQPNVSYGVSDIQLPNEDGSLSEGDQVTITVHAENAEPDTILQTATLKFDVPDWLHVDDMYMVVHENGEEETISVDPKAYDETSDPHKVSVYLGDIDGGTSIDFTFKATVLEGADGDLTIVPVLMGHTPKAYSVKDGKLTGDSIGDATGAIKGVINTTGRIIAVDGNKTYIVADIDANDVVTMRSTGQVLGEISGKDTATKINNKLDRELGKIDRRILIFSADNNKSTTYLASKDTGVVNTLANKSSQLFKWVTFSKVLNKTTASQSYLSDNLASTVWTNAVNTGKYGKYHKVDFAKGVAFAAKDSKGTLASNAAQSAYLEFNPIDIFSELGSPVGNMDATGMIWLNNEEGTPVETGRIDTSGRVLDSNGKTTGIYLNMIGQLIDSTGKVYGQLEISEDNVKAPIYAELKSSVDNSRLGAYTWGVNLYSTAKKVSNSSSLGIMDLNQQNVVLDVAGNKAKYTISWDGALIDDDNYLISELEGGNTVTASYADDMGMATVSLIIGADNNAYDKETTVQSGYVDKNQVLHYDAATGAVAEAKSYATVKDADWSTSRQLLKVTASANAVSEYIVAGSKDKLIGYIDKAPKIYDADDEIIGDVELENGKIKSITINKKTYTYDDKTGQYTDENGHPYGYVDPNTGEIEGPGKPSGGVDDKTPIYDENGVEIGYYDKDGIPHFYKVPGDPTSGEKDNNDSGITAGTNDKEGGEVKGTTIKDGDEEIGTENNFGDDDGDSKITIYDKKPGQVDPDPEKPFEGGQVIEVNDKGEITKFKYNDVVYVVNPKATKNVTDKVGDKVVNVKANEFWAEKNYVNGEFKNGADGYITLPSEGYAGNTIVMYKDYYVDPDGKIHETEEGENPVTPAADHSFQYDGKTYWVDPATNKFYDNKELNPPVKGWLDEFGIPHFIKDGTVGEKGDDGKINIRGSEDTGGNTDNTNPVTDENGNPIGESENNGDNTQTVVVNPGGDNGEGGEPDTGEGKIKPGTPIKDAGGNEIGKVDDVDKDGNITEFTYAGVKYYVNPATREFHQNPDFSDEAVGYIDSNNDIHFYEQKTGKVDLESQPPKIKDGDEDKGDITVDPKTKEIVSFTYDGATYYVNPDSDIDEFWAAAKVEFKDGKPSKFKGNADGYIDKDGKVHFYDQTVIGDVDPGPAEADIKPGTPITDDQNTVRGQVDKVDDKGNITEFTYDNVKYYVNPETREFHENPDFSDEAVGYLDEYNGVHFYDKSNTGKVDLENDPPKITFGDDDEGEIKVDDGKIVSFTHGDKTYYVKPSSEKQEFWESNKVVFKDEKPITFNGNPDGYIGEDGTVHFYDQSKESEVNPGPAGITPGTEIKEDGEVKGEVKTVEDGKIKVFTYLGTTYYVDLPNTYKDTRNDEEVDTYHFWNNPKYDGDASGFITIEGNHIVFYDKKLYVDDKGDVHEVDPGGDIDPDPVNPNATPKVWNIHDGETLIGTYTDNGFNHGTVALNNNSEREGTYFAAQNGAMFPVTTALGKIAADGNIVKSDTDTAVIGTYDHDENNNISHIFFTGDKSSYDVKDNVLFKDGKTAGYIDWAGNIFTVGEKVAQISNGSINFIKDETIGTMGENGDLDIKTGENEGGNTGEGTDVKDKEGNVIGTETDFGDDDDDSKLVIEVPTPGNVDPDPDKPFEGGQVIEVNDGKITKFEYNGVTYVVNPAAVKDVDDNKKTVKANEFWAEKNYVNGEFKNGADGYITLPGDGYAGNKIVMYKDYYVDPDGKIHETEEGENPVTPAADNSFKYGDPEQTYYVDPETGKFYDNKELNPPVKGWLDEFGIPHFIKDGTVGEKGENGEIDIRTGEDEKGGEGGGSTITNPDDPDNPIGSEDDFGDDKGDSKVDIFGGDAGDVDDKDVIKKDGVEIGKVDVREEGTNKIKEFTYDGIKYYVDTKDVTETPEGSEEAVAVNKFWKNDKFDGDASGYIILENEHIVFYTQHYYVDPDGKIHETEEGPEDVKAPANSFTHDGKTYYVDWTTKKFYDDPDFSGKVRGWIDDEGHPHFIKDGTVGEKGENGDLDIRTGEDEPSGKPGETVITDPNDPDNPIGSETDFGDDDDDSKLDIFGGEGGNVNNDDDNIYKNDEVIGKVLERDEATDRVTKFIYDGTVYYVDIKNDIQETPEGYNEPKTANKFYKNSEFSGDAAGYILLDNGCIFFYTQHYYVDPEGNIHETEEGDKPVTPSATDHSFEYGDPAQKYWVDPETGKFYDNEELNPPVKGWLDEDGTPHFIKDDVVGKKDKETGEIDLNKGEDGDKTGETEPSGDDGKFQVGDVIKDGEGNPIGKVTGVDNDGNISEFTYGNPEKTYWVDPETGKFYDNKELEGLPAGWVDENGGIHFYKQETAKASYINIYDNDGTTVIGIAHLDDKTGKIYSLEITQEGDRKGTYKVENNKIYDKETSSKVIGDIDGAGVVRWHSTEGGSITTGKVENDIKIYKDGVQIGVAKLNDKGEIEKLEITGPEGDARIGNYDVKDGKIIDINKIIKPNNTGSDEVGTISKTGEISWFDLTGGTVVSGGSSTDEKTLTDDEGTKIGVANIDNGHIVKFEITSGDNQGIYYVNPDSAKHEFWAANEDGSAPDYTGKALGYVDYDNNDKIYFYDFTTGTKSDQIKMKNDQGEVIGYADLDEDGNIYHFTIISPHAEYWVDTETGKFYDNEELNPPVKGTIDKNGKFTIYQGDDVVAGGDATEQTIVDPETGKTIGTKKDFEDGTSKITLIDEDGNKTEYFKDTDNKLYNWTDEKDDEGNSLNPNGKAVGEIDPVTGKITIYGTTTVLDKDPETGDLTANGDDLGDKENDDNEIIDPTTGKPIGQIGDDGDLTLNTGDEKDGGEVDKHTTIITGGNPEGPIGTNTDFGDKKGDSHITITGKDGEDDEEYYVDSTEPVGNVYGTEKGGPVTVDENNEFTYGDPAKTYVVDPTTGKFYDKEDMPEEGGYPEKPAGWIDPDGTIHIIDYTDYTDPAGVGTFDKEKGDLDIDDTRGKDKGTVETDKDIIKDPETNEPIGEKTDLGDGTDVITTPGDDENPGETLYVDKDGDIFGTTDGGNVSNDPAMVGPNGEQNGTYTKADPENGWEGEITFTDPEKTYVVDENGNIYEKDPESGDPIVKPDDKKGFITDDGEIHWINKDDPAGNGERDENGNLTNVEIRTGMIYGGNAAQSGIITNAEGGKIGDKGSDEKFAFTFSYIDQAFNYREQPTYYVSDDDFNDGTQRFFNSDKSEMFGLVDTTTGDIYFYKFTKGNVTDEHPLTDDGKEIGTATTDKDGNITTVTIGDNTYYVGDDVPGSDGSKYLYDNKELKGNPVGEIDKDNKVKLYTVVTGKDTGEHPVYDETGEQIGTATTDENGNIKTVTVGDNTYYVDDNNELYDNDKFEGKPVGKIDPKTGKITMYDIVNGELEHDTGLKDKEGNDIGDKDDEGNTNLNAEELGKEKNDLEKPWEYIVDDEGNIIGKYNKETGEIEYFGEPPVKGTTGTDINIKGNGDPAGPAGTPDKEGNITIGGEGLGGEEGTFIVDPETGEIIGKINEDGTITYYAPYPKESGTGTTERGSEVVDPETGKKISDEDEEGNITVPSGNIGSNENGKYVVDDNGNIIGKINDDGTITYYDPYPKESGKGDVTNKTVVTDEEGNVIGEKIDNGDGTSTVIIYGDPDQIYVIDEEGNIHDATDGGNINDNPNNITGPEGEEGGKYTPTNPNDPKDPSGTITFGGDTPDDPDDDKTYIVDKDGNIHEQDTPGNVDPASKVKDETGETIGTYTPDPSNEDGKYLPGTLVLTGDPDDPNDDKEYKVDEKGDIHDPSITNTENGGGGNVTTDPENITGPHGETGGVYTPADPAEGLKGEIKFTDPEQTYTVDPDGTIKDESGNPIGKIDPETGDVTWTDVIGKYDPETGDITIGGEKIGTDSGEHDILDPETNKPIGTATDTDRDGDIDKIVIPGDPKADPPTEDKTYNVDDKGNLHETTEGGNALKSPENENIVGPNGEKNGKYEKSDPENGLEGTITFDDPKEEFKVDDKGNITDEKGNKVGEIDPETGDITWIDPDPSGKIDPGTGKIEIEGDKVGELDPETGDIIWIDKDTDGKHIVWTGTLTEKDGNKIEMEDGKLEVNGEKYHFDFDGNVYNENDDIVGYLDITGEMYITVPENKDLGHLDWVVEMRDGDGNVIADLSNQVILKDANGNDKYVIDGNGTVRDADVYKGTIGALGADGNADITNNGNKVGAYHGSDDEGLYTINFDGDDNTYYVNYLNDQIHKTPDFSDESVGYVNSKNDVIFYGDKIGDLYPEGVTVYPPVDPENPQPPYTVISGADDILTINWDLGTITNQDGKLVGYLKWNVDFKNNDEWHHVATDKYAEGPVLVFRQSLNDQTWFSIGQDGTVRIVKDGVVDPEVVGYLNHKNEVFLDKPDVTKTEDGTTVYTYHSILDKDGNILYDNIEKVGGVTYGLELVDVNGNSLGKTIAPSIKLKDADDKVIGNYNPDTGDVTDDEGNKQYEVYPDGVVTTGEDDKGHVEDGTIVTDEKGEWIGTYTPDDPEGDKLPGTLVLTGDPDDPNDDKEYKVDGNGDIHDPSITNTENGGGGNVTTDPENITGPHGETGGVYTPTGDPDDPENGLKGEIKFTDPEQTYTVDPDGTIKDESGNPIGKIDPETGDITWTDVIGKYDPETGKITDNKGDVIGTDSGDHKITDPETGETVGTVDPDTGEIKLFDPEETLFVDDEGKVHDSEDGGNVSNDPAMVGPNGEQNGTYTKADPENGWEGKITFTDPEKTYVVDPSGKITDPENNGEQVGFISDDGTIHWVGDEIGKIDPETGDLVINGDKVIGSYDDEFYLDWNAGKFFKITRDNEGAEISRVQVGYIGWSGTFTTTVAEGDDTPAQTSTMKSNGTFEYNGATYCLSQKGQLMQVNSDGTKTILANSKVMNGVVTLDGKEIGKLVWSAKLYANDGSLIRDLDGYTGIFDNEGNKLGNIDKDGNITDNDGNDVGTVTEGPLVVNGENPVTVIGAKGDKFKLVWKEGTLYKLNKDENGDPIDDVTGCKKVGHLEWSGTLTLTNGKINNIATNGIITGEAILDKDGKPVTDENGNPQYNYYYLNEDGKLLKVVDGKVTNDVVGMLDYDGDLYLTDENGKKTTKIGELKWSAQLVDEHGNVLADVTSAVKITDGEGHEIGYIDDEGIHLNGDKGWLDKNSNKVYDQDVNTDNEEVIASAKKIGSYTTDNDAVNTITIDGKTYQVSDEKYTDKDGKVYEDCRFLNRIKDGQVVTDENEQPEKFGYYNLATRYVETFETIAGKPYWDGVIRDANGNIIGDGHTKIVIKWNEGKLYNANDGREIGRFKWTGALYNDTRTNKKEIDPDTGVFTDFDNASSKYHYNYYVGGENYNKLYKVKDPTATNVEDKFFTEDVFKTDENGNFVLDPETGQKIKTGYKIVEVGYVDDYGNAYRYELKEVPYGDSGKTKVDVVPEKIGTLSWSVDAVNNEGTVLIHFEKKIVIRDADGNVIATIDPDGTVRDKDGKVISKPSNDRIIRGEDGSIVGYIVTAADERTIGILSGAGLDDSTFVRNDSGKQIGDVQSISGMPYKSIIAMNDGSKYFAKSDGETVFLYDDNECSGTPVGFVEGNLLKGYAVKHYTDATPEKNYVGTYDEKTGFIYTVDEDGNRKNIGEIDLNSGELTIYTEAPTKAEESDLKNGHVINGTIKGGEDAKDIIGEIGTNGRIIEYGENTVIGHIMSMTGTVVDPADYDVIIGSSYNDESQDHIVTIDSGDYAGNYYVSKSGKLYKFDDRNTAIGKCADNGDIIITGDKVLGYLNPEDGRVYDNPQFEGDPIGKRDEDGAIKFTKSSGTISDIQIVVDGNDNPIGTYKKGDNGIGTLTLDPTEEGAEAKTYYLNEETGTVYTDPECQNEVRCDYDHSDNTFGIGSKIEGTYGDDASAKATYEERTDEEGTVVGGVLTINDTGETYYVVPNDDGTYDIYVRENGEVIGNPINGSSFDPENHTFRIGYEAEGRITSNVQIQDADGNKIGTAFDQGRNRKQLVFDDDPDHKYDVANGNIYEDGQKVGEVVDGEIIFDKDSKQFGTDDMTKKIVDSDGNTIGIIEDSGDPLTPSNIYRADNDGNLLNEYGKPSDNPEKLGSYVFDEELGNYVVKDNDGNVLRVVTKDGETIDPAERGRGEQGLGDDNYGEQQPGGPTQDPNNPSVPPVSVTRSIEYKAGAGGTIQGAATQTLKQGETGSAVKAAPATGYRFVKWSDGVTTDQRTDSYDKIASKTTITANFELIPVPKVLPTMKVYAANASTGKVTLAQKKSFSLKGATVVANPGLNVPITGKVTYTSSNPAIAKVNAAGKVTADKKKTGSAKITIASVDNPANTKVITVKVVKKAKYKAIKALKKTNIKATYKVNKTVKVKVSKWNPSAPSNKNFTVTVSPKSKATLDPITNTVKFIGKGKVTITVKGTSEAKKIKVKVKVK